MKMNRKSLMLGVTFAVSAQIGTIATAAEVNGRADALVITPLSIAIVADMDFGTVAGGVGADAIVMDTAGGRNAVGADAQVIAAGAGAAASFTITGEPNQAYTVSFSADATLDDGGGNQMTVDTFTDNAPSPLEAGGTDNLLVGGTLRVGASQIAGAYSTTTGGTPYTVTVEYN